jgi:hypothetical protein
MENLIIWISIIFGIVGIALIAWVLIYSLSPSINGKEHIEKYMSEKYGEDWLEQCMEGLRNPEVRKSIADELKLKR